jgi:hypothetical protein
MRALWIIILIAGCGFHSPPGTATASDAAPGTDNPGSGQCPASYNVSATKLPGPSRYRLIIDGHRAWEQSDDCNDDLPGSTHLVVIETKIEFDDISAYIRPGLGTAGDSVWIGAVQLPIAAAVGADWLGFDGNPLFNGWGGSEPNDNNDNNELNHDEQFVRMTRTQPPYFIDDGGQKNYGAICECDGKPIAATVATAIDGYRL